MHWQLPLTEHYARPLSVFSHSDCVITINFIFSERGAFGYIALDKNPMLLRLQVSYDVAINQNLPIIYFLHHYYTQNDRHQ